MCDSIFIRGQSGLWFAKNSDREPDEPQIVEFYPAEKTDGARECTYITVDTPEHTLAVMLSRPDWMWGAEMGVNSKGVAIGNEAVFTRRTSKKGDALLGMDLVRLALEQADSADNAVQIITRYLEQYGQGGAAGYIDKRFRYDNAFLICDSSNVWQLETAGKSWAAKKLADYGAISNRLTLAADYDLASADLAKRPNFSRRFSQWWMPFFAKAKQRKQRVCMHLARLQREQTQGIDIHPADLAGILRQHEKAMPSGNQDICMHAQGKLRPSETTQSMLVYLRKNNTPKIWVTGGSSPCVSLYQTVSFDEVIWLLNQVGFWEAWHKRQQRAMVDDDYCQRLWALHRQYQPLMWRDDIMANQYANDWWKAVLALD